MALKKARYRVKDDEIVVIGHGPIPDLERGLVGSRSVVADVSMTSLRDAMVRRENYVGYMEPTFYMTDAPPEHIDDDMLGEQTNLCLKEGELVADTWSAAGEERPEKSVVESILAPALEQRRMQLGRLEISEEKWGWAIGLELHFPLRGRAVGTTIDHAQGVAEFLEAALSGQMDRSGVAALVQSGNAALLAGVFENEWLDAKSSPYRIDTPRGRFELAKDVAAFANSTGGLILVGAKTKHTPDGDQIRTINECRLRDAPILTYRNIIERQIYPPVEDVAVSAVEGATPEMGLVLIEVPEQDQSNFPFLVSGMAAGDRVSELGFTIAKRIGDGTEGPKVETVHAQLRAGIAGLGGHGPIPRPVEVTSSEATS
jgi:hypothetical protein